MVLRKTFFMVCLIVSALCLAAGYGITGQWIGAAVSIITGPAWLLARKHPGSWLPFICLLASVCLAVIGNLLGVPAWLMICGAGFALAAWDLILLNGALGNHAAEEQTHRYEISHLRTLTLALGAGLVVACLGQSLHIQIPFAAMVLFIGLVLFGLDRAWRLITKSENQ